LSLVKFTVALHDCPDFPDELSKFSLTEQPSPLYCEKKTDLWRHINETVLEEADYDSSQCNHHHLNPLQTVNPGYLPVLTHAGQLVLLRHGFSLDDIAGSTMVHHNNGIIINGSGTGCPSSWSYRHSGAVNTVDDIVLSSASLNHNAGQDASRRYSLDCREQNSAALMPGSNNTAQTVSYFLFSLFS